MSPAWLLERVRSRLLAAWAAATGRVGAESAGNRGSARTRVLYVANSYLPTLQLCFVKPLQALADAGELATELLSLTQLEMVFGRRLGEDRARRWVERRFERFDPTVVVFCRYSGPHARAIRELAASRGVPTIYHIDDDLLHVPSEIGAKAAWHNDPGRVAAVRWLLQAVDLVYCSTPALLQRLRSHGLAADGLTGAAHCASDVLAGPPLGRPVTIGYMGIDHAHDFEVAAPALAEVMRDCPEVRFEIFGPMQVPASLRQFGPRIRSHPPVHSYPQFLRVLESLRWDIGICPLAPLPFNALKSNNKWVEYTAVGAAVVATAGSIYDACCAVGCGRLVSDDVQWREALTTLVRDHQERAAQVSRAQERLRRDFSVEALRRQVLEVFEEAGRRARMACRQAQE